MTGIQYITDEQGKRVGVQIDLREHGALWEDYYDSWLARQTADDEWISWEDAKKQLRANRPSKSGKTAKKPAKRTKK